MPGDERLRRGRRCYERHAWREARDLLTACDATSPLDVADLERLAVASFLSGEDETSDDAWRRAHQRYLASKDRSGSVRCAFWLGFRLLNAGDLPSADGWIARLERLVRDAPDISTEYASLSYLTGLLAVFTADLPRAENDLGRSVRIADACGDPDLSALARLALGRVLIFRGDVSGGCACSTRRWSRSSRGRRRPSWGRQLLHRHRRLPRRVRRTPGPGLDRGVRPLVRHPARPRALRRALPGPPRGVPAAEGCLGRGDGPGRARPEAAVLAGRPAFTRSRDLPAGGAAAASRTFRRRGAALPGGQQPRKGSATRARAAPAGQGRHDAAAHGIDRALAEADDLVSRPQLLAACVEIMLAVGDVPAARAASAELVEAARALGSPMLAAVSDRATGAVVLADGDARAALAPLRRASSGFRALEATYDLARTGVLIARARRVLGDEEGARFELEAARALSRDSARWPTWGPWTSRTGVERPGTAS